MPYSSNRELPDSVKRALPSHAQDIYREAFDNAWQEYSDPSKRRGNESLEESRTRWRGLRLRNNTRRWETNGNPKIRAFASGAEPASEQSTS